MQDNGTSVSVGSITPSVIYQMYVYRSQLTVNGDGQHSLYGYRTRDSQNDGTSYAQIGANTATTGFNFWGDVYTFGVGGWSYNDYSRTGGVLGADVNGLAWGSLGYRSSGLLNYGVYGSAAYANGGGRMASAEPTVGIGGGFHGDLMGGWVRGDVMGLVSTGPMFAAYNLGNEYTSGKNVELVRTATGKVAPAFSMTSTDSKVYADGRGTLKGKTTRVAFDAAYADLLSTEGDAVNVTVSPMGQWANLYIVSVDRTGFTVAEASGSGKVTVQFSWVAVGKRIGEKTKVPSDLLSADFDEKMDGVMFGEGNRSQSGKPAWFDGAHVRFSEPTFPKKVKPAEQRK